MKRIRLGLILLAIAGAILAIVVLIGSVLGFYGQVALTSPTLAKILLGLILAICQKFFKCFHGKTI